MQNHPHAPNSTEADEVVREGYRQCGFTEAEIAHAMSLLKELSEGSVPELRLSDEEETAFRERIAETLRIRAESRNN